MLELTENTTEGSLFGKWLNLSDYSDYNELIDAMRDLHKDEEDQSLCFKIMNAVLFCQFKADRRKLSI